MLKRMARIDPPYYASALLVLLSMFLTSLHPMARGSYSYDPLAILLHVGYLVDLFHKFWLNPVFWTLAIEFQFYLLLGMLFPLLTKGRFTAILTIFFLGMTCFLLPLVDIFFVSVPTVFRFYLHFALGITLFCWYVKKLKSIETMLLCGIFLALLFVQFGLDNALVLVVSSYIMMFTDINTVVTRFLGKISYSLYLIHAVIGAKILSISTLFIQDYDIRLLLMWAVFAFTLFCSYLFYKFVEKPSLELSQKVNLK